MAVFAVAGAVGTGLAGAPAPYDAPVLKRVRRAPKPPADLILYELTPVVNSEPRKVQVAMHFAVAGNPDTLTLQMPVWSPGDYHYQDHGKAVENLQVVDDDPDDNRALPVTHSDPNNWQIQVGGAEQITVTYTLPETKPGFFSENVQLRPKQAFFNGPATYLYIAGRKNTPSTVALHLPATWQVETALPKAATQSADIPAFAAPDYDTLADSPIVAAAPDAITVREFTVNDIPHKAVYFGKIDAIKDFDAFTPMLKKVVQAETKIMGGVPYKRYDFLFEAGGRGGGLEHLNSARLSLFPGITPAQYAPFVAHEFFHLWNVKRIRPRSLGPFDYINPPRTRNLWFAEGVTEYYAHVATRRAGLTSEENFLAHWKRAIASLERNPAHAKVTADDASLKVWDAGNSDGFGGLSYYQKGELIGLCLDLKIRGLTAGKKSLDDVMRLLMQRHAPPKRGYEEDELRDVVSEVAGQDLSAFYDLLARSTKEMLFAECLAYAGLDADLKPLPDATPAQLALRKSWSGESAE